MIKQILTGLIRHALTTGGGALIAQGLLSQSDLEAVIGAVLTILGVVWSVWVKKRASATGDRGQGGGNGGRFPGGTLRFAMFVLLLAFAICGPLRGQAQETTGNGTTEDTENTEAATAATTNAPAAPKPDDLSAVGSAQAEGGPTIQSGFQQVLDALWGGQHQWYFVPYGLYAEGLDHKWGGGLGAFYPLSDLLVTGIRLDYVDGGFWMPSGNAVLQVPLQPVKAWPWLKITPFGYAGIGVPLSGAKIGDVTVPGEVRNNNGEPTAILGYGGAIALWANAAKTWSVSGIGDVEKWEGFPGRQYRLGLAVKHEF